MSDRTLGLIAIAFVTAGILFSGYAVVQSAPRVLAELCAVPQ